MNKIIVIAILSSFFLICCNPKDVKPEIFIKDRIVDLEEIEFDSTYKIHYKIANNGGSELLIDTITSSCGCSVPSISLKNIPPAMSSDLLIEFKPIDTGYFDKKIVLKSNIDSVFTVLTFKGRVVK